MPFRTVLIVDTDIGFVFWLGRVLADGGYQPVPARSVSAAILLLPHIAARIDILIVNTSLQRSGSFINRLRCSQTNLKVIAVAENVDVGGVSGLDASKGKPLNSDQSSKAEWLELVGNVIGETGLEDASAFVV